MSWAVQVPCRLSWSCLSRIFVLLQVTCESQSRIREHHPERALDVFRPGSWVDLVEGTNELGSNVLLVGVSRVLGAELDGLSFTVIEALASEEAYENEPSRSKNVPPGSKSVPTVDGSKWASGSGTEQAQLVVQSKRRRDCLSCGVPVAAPPISSASS